MTPEQHTPALQRRNLGLLVAAQSLGGASPPIIISLGGLVGQQLSTNPTATTLPVSIYQLGLALSTLPAAWLMQRMGRRTAYVLGAVSQWTLIFAWAFTVARLVQSLVHMTSNNTSHRGGAFVLGVLALAALWINVGMAVFARL